MESEDPTNDAVILGDIYTIPTNIPVVTSDNELNAKIRSLNQKQREYFDIAYNWAKKFVKNLSSESKAIIQQLHVFITRGCWNRKVISD